MTPVRPTIWRALLILSLLLLPMVVGGVCLTYSAGFDFRNIALLAVAIASVVVAVLLGLWQVKRALPMGMALAAIVTLTYVRTAESPMAAWPLLIILLALFPFLPLITVGRVLRGRRK